jgi:hypothetical protein
LRSMTPRMGSTPWNSIHSWIHAVVNGPGPGAPPSSRISFSESSS